VRLSAPASGRELRLSDADDESPGGSSPEASGWTVEFRTDSAADGEG